MAKVLSMVPVFFNSRDEIKAYFLYALENCRDDILKRLRDGSIDDTLREDQQIEADIYRQAIEHEARLLRQLEERGDV